MSKDQEPKKAKTGRPSAYTPELGNYICAQMAEGRSLKSICEDEDTPNIATVFRWLASDQYTEFRDSYAHAREQRADAMFEEMQTIADEARLDYIEVVTKSGASKVILNSEAIQRSRLRIEARQWMLARMSPKKYGDKMQVEQKVDITKHYVEDDVSALDRYIEKRDQEKAAARKLN